MFDPSKHKEDEYEIPTRGEKVLACVRIERGETKAGKPQVFATWGILRDRVCASGQKGDAGKLVFDRVLLTPEAEWRLAQLCRAIGQKTPFDQTNDDALAAVFTQAEIVGIIDHEEYDGKTRATIRKFARYGGERDPSWDEEIEKLTAKADKSAAKAKERRGGGSSSGGGSGATPPSGGGGTESGASSEFDDDSIPFARGPILDPTLRWV